MSTLEITRQHIPQIDHPEFDLTRIYPATGNVDPATDMQRVEVLPGEESLLLYPEFKQSLFLRLGTNVLELTRREEPGTGSQFIRPRQEFTFTNVGHDDKPSVIIPHTVDRSGYKLRIGRETTPYLGLNRTADPIHFAAQTGINGLKITDLNSLNGTVIFGDRKDIDHMWQRPITDLRPTTGRHASGK